MSTQPQNTQPSPPRLGENPVIVAERPTPPAAPASLARSPASAPGTPDGPVLVAVPAHNEARFIGSVVLWARRYVDTVLVIDDGSSDRTAELAEAAGAVVLRHERNQGKGEAVNTAFREARRRQAAALVLIDGDGQHRADEIAAVLEPVLADRVDMAVGSRFLNISSEIPAYRKVGQHGLTMATNLASGVRLTDSQSGFRAFSRPAINVLSFRGSGFSVESEMQFLVRDHDLRVAEVPISVVYEERAKRNPVAHGTAVLHGVVRLVSQGRPLFFFGTPGLALALFGFLVGGNVVYLYDAHQQLAIGYGMLAVLLMIVGVLALFTGIMLHALRGLLVDLRRAETE